MRSRTPDPDPSDADEDTFGVPLTRISTAPPARHAGADPNAISVRTKSEQERERARANKLMKMGLLAHDSFPRTGSPYAHSRNGGSLGGVGGGKPRFGGLRGVFQTLTGKS